MEYESLLEALYEDESLDLHDIDMEDVEELPQKSEPQNVKPNSVVSNAINLKTRKKKKKARKSKKKPNKENAAVEDQRFILQISKRLGEKKIHLIKDAVNVLGLSAMKDLVIEVEAIQRCGGQMTADGNRHRTGGGILFNILRARQPKAYKEIMARGRRFIKQVKAKGREMTSSVKRPTKDLNSTLSSEANEASPDDVSEIPRETATNTIGNPERSCERVVSETRVSVWNRLRVPVSYEDLADDKPEEGELIE